MLSVQAVPPSTGVSVRVTLVYRVVDCSKTSGFLNFCSLRPQVNVRAEAFQPSPRAKKTSYWPGGMPPPDQEL